MSYIVKGVPFGNFSTQSLVPDGVTDTFNLNFRPGMSSQLVVVWNGVIQEPKISYNLISGGRKIRFTFVPDAGTSLFLLYLGREISVPVVAGNYPLHMTVMGDGINAVFTLPVSPVDAALQVFKNGILQFHLTQWNLSGNQVTFVNTPAIGDRVDFYIHGVERTDLFSVDDNSITSAKLNLVYLPYSPIIQTFNGMDRSAPVVSVAKYLSIGKVVQLRLLFTTTLSGTPNDSIRVSLPIDNDGTTLVAGSVKAYTSTIKEVGLLEWSGLNSMDIKRQESLDFTLDTWTFEVVTEYETI